MSYPRDDALAVAREIAAALRPRTERLVVAGSLRRKKERVGDIELVYIPAVVSVPDGFWDEEEVNLADSTLNELLAKGVLAQRRNVHGYTLWGPKNKLAVHRRSGIPVDFFCATPQNWWNYLVCRTGSAASNRRIASAAKAKGWTWNPYGSGFTDEHGEVVAVNSEQDVWQHVGLEYLEPCDRN